MTMPVFPPTLPPPQRDNYQAARGDGRVRRARDAGPRNTRRRYSSVADPVSMTFQFTADQRALFYNWFDHEVGQGTIPFVMPDWTRHGWPLDVSDGDPLIDDTGSPLTITEERIVQFGDRLPSETLRGISFLVTFDVEVLA